MKCPFCGGTELRVLRSRPEGTGIFRRRSCMTCNEIFTSIEQVQIKLMRCPQCLGENVSVIGSEHIPTEDGGNVRRDCHCDDCATDFETWECYEQSDPESAFVLSEILDVLSAKKALKEQVSLIRTALMSYMQGSKKAC